MGKAARIYRRLVAAAALNAVAAIVTTHAHAAPTGTYEKGPVQPVRPVQDYWVEAAAGRQRGVFTIHKFGKNSDVGALTTEDIWEVGGNILFSSQPVRVRVAAGGNAQDDPLGSGAGTLTVMGLDANWDLYQENIYTSGTAAGPLSNGHFMRVYNVFVATMGANASYVSPSGNAGAISIQTSSGNPMALIGSGVGQSKTSLFTVPRGYTCHLTGELFCSVAASKAADCNLWQRPNAWDVSGALAGARRVVWSDDQVIGLAEARFDGTPTFTEMTDLWGGASAASGSASSVSMDYDLICRSNTVP